jgi:hypothetical protein
LSSRFIRIAGRDDEYPVQGSIVCISIECLDFFMISRGVHQMSTSFVDSAHVPDGMLAVTNWQTTGGVSDRRPWESEADSDCTDAPEIVPGCSHAFRE